MSVGFHQLVVDDTVELKGPLGSFIWHGKGMALWRGMERRVRNIGLICAGSGELIVAPRIHQTNL
jgi:nitrate reductase (NAD(P)H)